MYDDFPLFYPSYACLFLINSKGQLKVLFTPFQVLCIEDVHVIKKGTIVYVEAVLLKNKVGFVYVINGFEYPFYNFKIHSKF